MWQAFLKFGDGALAFLTAVAASPPVTVLLASKGLAWLPAVLAAATTAHITVLPEPSSNILPAPTVKTS